MWHHFLPALKTTARGNRTRGDNSRKAGHRPRIEALEERCLLSADVVLEWNALAIEAAKIDHGLNAPQLQFGPTRVGRVMAIVHAAIADGTWSRLKACREPTCEWAFYDYTKNRSGAWCTMDVCGNRAKARAYRERRAASAGQ